MKLAAKRKKTLLLDQALLDDARRLLRARTEAAAVTAALESVVQRERQIEGLRKFLKLGPVDASLIDG